MQRVDPFIRASPPRPRAPGRPGVSPSVPPPITQQASTPRPHPIAKTAKPQKQNRWRKLQFPALVLLAMVLGTFAQYLIVGYVALGIYLAAVLAKGIRSRRTFMLALIALVAVAAAQLMGRTQIVESFSVYSFLLFAIGTLSLIIEVIRGGRRRKVSSVKT